MLAAADRGPVAVGQRCGGRRRRLRRAARQDPRPDGGGHGGWPAGLRIGLAPPLWGLASLGLYISVFCDFLYRVLLLSAILMVDFLGRTLSRAQAATTSARSSRRRSASTSPSTTRRPRKSNTESI